MRSTMCSRISYFDARYFLYSSGDSTAFSSPSFCCWRLLATVPFIIGPSGPWIVGSITLAYFRLIARTFSTFASLSPRFSFIMRVWASARSSGVVSLRASISAASTGAAISSDTTTKKVVGERRMVPSITQSGPTVNFTLATTGFVRRGRLREGIADRMTVELVGEPFPGVSLRAPNMGRHVLIVDDDPDTREALLELLQSWGHDVDVAADGCEAVTLALERRPEIVLLDLGLPDITGQDVA